MLDRATPPALSDFPPLTLPDFEETVLDNGVRLLMFNSGDEKVTRMTLLWQAGTLDVDSPAALGLMAAMMSEGCNGLTGKDVTDRLESNGAWFKATAARNSFFLFLHSLNHTAPEIFPLLADMVSCPDFPTASLDSIKKKSAAEKELAACKPSYQANVIAREKLYGKGSPLAHAVTPDDILAVTRDDLVTLHRNMILSNKPVIFISGRVTEEIRRLAASTFGEICFSTQNPDRIIRHLSSSALLKGKETCHKDMPGSLQTGVIVQIPAVGRDHPDFEALRFVTVALGGYFGSRLMSNIREDKGYTYGISATLTPRIGGGDIVISCECDNKYTDAVIQEINNEIDRLASEKMETEEIETVRNIVISGMAGILDSPFSISSYRELLEASAVPPQAFREQFATVASITPPAVMELTRKYIQTAPRVTAMAGGKPG